MFDNIGSLRLVPNNIEEIVASAMVSCENEVMEFRTSISTDTRIETWMTGVLAEMQRTNRYITKKSIFDYGKVRRPR